MIKRLALGALLLVAMVALAGFGWYLSGAVRTVSHINTAEKVVFLTFDDGPDPRYTQAILDILNAEHVPATFFLIGQKVEADRGRTDYTGHLVGYHTYSHEAQLGKLPKEQIADFQRGVAAMPATYPVGSGYYRAPRKQAYPPTIAWADERGTYLLWDGTYEKEIRAPKFLFLPLSRPVKSHDERVAAVVKAVRPGSIVLMHDGSYFTKYLVEDLRDIIRELKARGYEFSTPEAYGGRR